MRGGFEDGHTRLRTHYSTEYPMIKSSWISSKWQERKGHKNEAFSLYEFIYWSFKKEVYKQRITLKQQKMIQNLVVHSQFMYVNNLPWMFKT